MWTLASASVWGHIFCIVVFSFSLNTAAEQSKFKLHWKILNGMVCLVKCDGFYIRDVWNHWWQAMSRFAQKAFLRLVIMWQYVQITVCTHYITGHSIHVTLSMSHSLHVTCWRMHITISISENAHHSVHVIMCTHITVCRSQHARKLFWGEL